MLIVADIAGQFDALMRLVAKRPIDEKYILLGDLMDRGPRSWEVVDWAMKNPNVQAIKGNHEDMMIDFFRKTQRYSFGIWRQNGGSATLENYHQAPRVEHHIDWLEKLPLYIETEHFICTHAPIHPLMGIEGFKKAAAEGDVHDHMRMMWNRDKPKHDKKLQIFGHNSHWGLREFTESDQLSAICLDESQNQVLLGFDPNKMEVIVVPYDPNLDEGTDEHSNER